MAVSSFAYNVEHLFMSILIATHLSHLVKCLFKYFPIIFVQFVYLLLIFSSFLYILITRLLMVIYLQLLSPILFFTFHFPNTVLIRMNCLNLDDILFIDFVYFTSQFWISIYFCPIQFPLDVFLIISSRNVRVLTLKFNSNANVYFLSFSLLLWYLTVIDLYINLFQVGPIFILFIFYLLKNFFYLLFNWRIIDLQYCAGFCHTPTSISHRYTHAASHLNLPLTSHSIAFSVVFCSIFTYL